MQLKVKAYPLPEDQYQILRLVDGRTTATDLMRGTLVPQPQFDGALAALLQAGLIRDASALPERSGAAKFHAVAPEEIDLDFTHLA
jgi:hypothetical protein